MVVARASNSARLSRKEAKPEGRSQLGRANPSEPKRLKILCMNKIERKRAKQTQAQYHSSYQPFTSMLSLLLRKKCMDGAERTIKDSRFRSTDFPWKRSMPGSYRVSPRNRETFYKEQSQQIIEKTSYMSGNGQNNPSFGTDKTKPVLDLRECRIVGLTD